MEEELQRVLMLQAIQKAVKEMEEIKLHEMFQEMDIREVSWKRYNERLEELKVVYEFVHAGGSGKSAYRHMQMNIFGKHESFFMDLFESQLFPQLFELFEFVWR